MRKSLAGVILALLAGLLALGLTTGAATAATPSLNAARGHGTLSGTAVFKFNTGNVPVDPLSDAAKGTFTFIDAGIYYRGEVTCLRVEGEKAIFSGRVTKSSDPVFGDGNAAFFVDVTGSGETGGEDDRFDYAIVAAAEPGCVEPFTATAIIDEGDIFVFDAPDGAA